MFSIPEALLVILVALVGGAVGKMANVPGGTLLASTVAVAAVCIGLDFPHTPPEPLILFIQLLMGCMLGQSVNRRFWRDFMDIWRTTLVVVGVFSAISIPFAFLLVRAFGFDPILAVLAATPARMQDMIILAGSMNSDAITVMVMQMTRLFSIVLVTPFILRKYSAPAKTPLTRTENDARGVKRRLWQSDYTSYVILVAPGVLGAALGFQTGHMLGVLLGSFSFVAASRLIWLRAGEVPFPRPLAFLIQSLAGILLGARITLEIGSLLAARIVPVTIACGCVLGGGFLIAVILHRHYGWNKALSWMAAAPGRGTDMLAMAQDIDLTAKDRLALMCMHTVRQVYFTLFVTVAVTIL